MRSVIGSVAMLALGAWLGFVQPAAAENWSIMIYGTGGSPPYRIQGFWE